MRITAAISLTAVVWLLSASLVGGQAAQGARPPMARHKTQQLKEDLKKIESQAANRMQAEAIKVHRQRQIDVAQGSLIWKTLPALLHFIGRAARPHPAGRAGGRRAVHPAPG